MPSVPMVDMISRLRKVCDVENDSHVSDAELEIVIMSAFREYVDLLIANGIHDYANKVVDFVTIPGVTVYELNSNYAVPDEDFYQLQQLYVEDSGHYRKVQRVNPAEIFNFTAPKSAVNMRLVYTPLITAASSPIDGGNGHEEFVLMSAACHVKQKREEDYRLFFNRKKEVEKRILAMADIDMGEPHRIVRKRRTFRDPWNFFQQSVNAYTIRNQRLELYCLSGYIPGA